jgi:hypothetical protein
LCSALAFDLLKHGSAGEYRWSLVADPTKGMISRRGHVEICSCQLKGRKGVVVIESTITAECKRISYHSYDNSTAELPKHGNTIFFQEVRPFKAAETEADASAGGGPQKRESHRTTSLPSAGPLRAFPPALHRVFAQ